MPQYQIVAGKHHLKGKNKGETVAKVAGDVIELSDAEAAKFPNKFRRVEVVAETAVPIATTATAKK
jgi:hypothetical protein